MIQVKKTTLSVADIAALFTTPKIILAAPAAGSVNNILGVTWHIRYNTTPWTPHTCNVGQTQNPIDILYQKNNISANSDVNTAFDEFGNKSICSATKDLQVQAGGADPVGGDSEIDVYVIYENIVTI